MLGASMAYHRLKWLFQVCMCGLLADHLCGQYAVKYSSRRLPFYESRTTHGV
jgi:hypothetical protein